MVSLTLPINGIMGLGLYAFKINIGKPLSSARNILEIGGKSLKSSKNPTNAAITIESRTARYTLLDSGTAMLRKVKDVEKPISMDIPTISGILGLSSLCTSIPTMPLFFMKAATLGIDMNVVKKLIINAVNAWMINMLPFLPSVYNEDV